ncbi:MAG: hypothetical protein WCG98_00580 [bacterium]
MNQLFCIRALSAGVVPVNVIIGVVVSTVNDRVVLRDQALENVS